MALSTAYHPQTDGETERVNQEVETYLRIYCGNNPTSWTESIAHAEFAHNHRPHSITGKSPFYLMMGYEPTPLPNVLPSSPLPAVEEHLRNLQAARLEALAAHELARQTMAARTRRRFTPFKKGEKVWLEARNLKRNVTNPKFTPKREGPFSITDILSPITYRLRLPRTWKIHPVFHASLLSPYCENSVHGPNFPKPPPDLITGEEEYEIDRILRHRGKPRNCSFLIQWKGYSAEEDSWVSEKDLSHATEALQEYKTLHPSAFPQKIRAISRFQPGLSQPTPLSAPILPAYPSSCHHHQTVIRTYQLPTSAQYWSRKSRTLVLQDRLLPVSRHLKTMPCSYFDEPAFFERGERYPGLTLSDKEGEEVIVGANAERLTDALHASIPSQRSACCSPNTPSSPSSLQPSTINPMDTTPSSPTSTCAEARWGQREQSTTFTNATPNTPAPYPVVSVDVPIFGHRLVDQFLDQDGMTSMQEYLRNPRLAIPIGAHLDLASPLYALYKTYLQVSRLNQVAHDLQNSNALPLIISTIRDIRHDALGEICIALHQLGMQDFLTDLDRFVKENHAALRMPPPVFGTSSTPSTSSNPTTHHDTVFFRTAQTELDRLQGTAPLLPTHPKYSDTCFQCHHLGHLRTNCPVYQCPLCLHWAPGHPQMRCPLRRRTNPPTSSSSTSPTSSRSTSSGQPRPVPPPRLNRRSRRQTVRITPYANPSHGRGHHTPYPTQRGGMRRPDTPDMEEDYDGAAEANITGSPGGEYRDY